MPVIEIQALPQKQGVDVQRIIKRVTTSVAKVIDASLHAVFNIWNEIKSKNYTEGESTSIYPDDTHPPVVHVTMFEGRSYNPAKKALVTIADKLNQGL